MTVRDQYPAMAEAVDKLRAMGHDPRVKALFSMEGELLAGRRPEPDPPDWYEMRGESVELLCRLGTNAKKWNKEGR